MAKPYESSADLCNIEHICLNKCDTLCSRSERTEIVLLAPPKHLAGDVHAYTKA